jgi:succinate dehydrogenase / fumarate reductase, cytochrome b subunit
MSVKSERPTSPHLQIYRLPLTGLISITHRITGVALLAGLLLVVYMLFALMQGESAFLTAQHWANFWLGKVVYWGFIFALFFHLCHGIRHLFWDIGEGFAAETLHKFALIELLAASALTLWTLLFA